MSVHPHQREHSSGQRELSFALLITSAIMVVEWIAGLVSGSLALLADAGHMLTDAFALSLSLFAAWIASRPTTSEKTYGYYRTEILAALVNGVVLWLLVIWIGWRAIHRLQHPSQILTGPMLAAAVLGLAANLISGKILFQARQHSLNVQGAWIHVLSDALGSCGVIVAGVAIRWKGWTVADPLVSFFIALLIGINSWILVRRAVNILLEGAPTHLHLPSIIEAMQRIDGVREVHDIHLWTITTGMEAMSGHVIIERFDRGPDILAKLNAMLSQRFAITHTTFQLEPPHGPGGMPHPSAAMG